VLPSVSIVIPTYRRPGQLGECLQSLARLDYPRDLLEVVVVDDGGPTPLDPVVAPFRSTLGLTLLRQANGGPAAARNTGVERATGDYLAFTDDDCLVDPGWLRALAAVWAERPGSMAGGVTLNGAPGTCSAANMALPAGAFRDLGGFDPDFRAAEDRDLCDRWLQRGHRIVLTPAAQVHHVRPLNVASFWRQHFHYGRGAERFSRRRSARRSGSMLAEARFHLDVRNWLWRPLTSVPARRAAPVAALLGLWQAANLAGFCWEALRRRVPGHRDGALCPSG
jgi:glycosyltransferase involved in cell wall biosynthesis